MSTWQQTVEGSSDGILRTNRFCAAIAALLDSSQGNGVCVNRSESAMQGQSVMSSEQ